MIVVKDMFMPIFYFVRFYPLSMSISYKQLGVVIDITQYERLKYKLVPNIKLEQARSDTIKFITVNCMVHTYNLSTWKVET